MQDEGRIQPCINKSKYLQCLMNPSKIFSIRASISNNNRKIRNLKSSIQSPVNMAYDDFATRAE
jgi:hypothetical protein